MTVGGLVNAHDVSFAKLAPKPVGDFRKHLFPVVDSKGSVQIGVLRLDVKIAFEPLNSI